jgi:hypothetical protein
MLKTPLLSPAPTDKKQKAPRALMLVTFLEYATVKKEQVEKS